MEAKLGMSDYNSYDAYHQDLNFTFHSGISDTSAHYWCLNLALGRVVAVEGWCVSPSTNLTKKKKIIVQNFFFSSHEFTFYTEYQL